MIYLDNSATTKPCPEAVAAMTDVLTNCWGNPSALYQFGMEADHRLRQARKSVAAALGAEEDRVFFTSGGTEADNWAIFGAVERLRKRGRHIVTTAVEHHAVLHPMEKLQAQGFEVAFLQPGPDGAVSLEDFTAALRPDTILASVMMVNNESGAVMPIAEMVRAVRRKSPLALFHTDAVQGFGKVPFKAKTLGADLITISSHKIHGPKGAGALYVKKGLQLPPLLLGGGQESGYRSGTEGMPAIVGFGAACAALDIPAEIARLTELRDACRASLSGSAGGAASGGRNRAPYRLPVPAGAPESGDSQLPPGPGHLRLRRVGLRQGPSEPCALGHGPAAPGHRRGHPRLLRAGQHPRRCGCPPGRAAGCAAYFEGIRQHRTIVSAAFAQSFAPSVQL